MDPSVGAGLGQNDQLTSQLYLQGAYELAYSGGKPSLWLLG